MLNRRKSGQAHHGGQALAEIAIFGAILIFLLGTIIRSHMNMSYNQNYKVRATKFALKKSIEGSQGGETPNIAHNSANVMFIEDRLSPDLNKYNTLDRSPFIAQGSGTMTNMLQYPVDYSDEYKRNIPIMDLFVNGQHFELTVASFVYRTLYTEEDDCLKFNDLTKATYDLAEYDRCLRQLRESDDDKGALPHKFFSQAVNGTDDFDKDCGNDCWDFLRRGNVNKLPPDVLRPYMSWQWQKKSGIYEELDFGTEEEPKYPLFDTSGSLREQTIYYASSDPQDLDDEDCLINSNKNLVNIILCGKKVATTDPRVDTPNGPLAAVGVMDYQLGDMDQGFDKDLTPGYNSPGPMQDMRMYTNINNDKESYLEIQDNKLLDPLTNGFVRSVSNKDKVDLISRPIQLSNDTGRLCKDKFEDGTKNPVKACVPNSVSTSCLSGPYFSLTCFDRRSRILYVRSFLIDKSVRKWFTNITQGI